MKRISSFFALIFLVFSCMILVACGADDEETLSFPEEFNWLDGSVSNIGDYDQVGAVSMLKQDENGKLAKQVVLAGIDEDGNACEIEFSKDGQKKKTQLTFEKFNQTQNYYIVEFSTKKESSFDGVASKFENYVGKDYGRIYIIEKETNKMFALSVRETPVQGKETFYIGESEYGTFGDDCGKYIILKSGSYYYKVGVDENKLRIKQIFSLKTQGSSQIMFSDKYGNSVIKRTTAGQDIFTILTDEVELISVEASITHIYKGADGQIYSTGKVLNGSGFFVSTDDIVEECVLRTEDLVYTNGNDKYFYSTDWERGKNKVVKFSDNGTDVSLEEIELNLDGIVEVEGSTEVVRVGNFLFGVFGDNQIEIINLLNGDITPITIEAERVSKIWAYENNKIGFETSAETKGTLSVGGEINYDYVDPSFTALLVVPTL